MSRSQIMMNNLAHITLPAEWHPQSGVMIAWPHEFTDWVYMLEEVTACFIEIAKAIADDERLLVVAPDIELPRRLLADAGVNEANVIYATAPTNDTWARDFGPISLISPEGGRVTLCDFTFNAWGLKFAADKDNLITSLLHRNGTLGGDYVNCLDFVLEGGSIESDGRGTLLTTTECLLSPNRNGAFSQQQIEQMLKERLGMRKVLWVNHGYLAGDDTDSHIDTLARFAPDNTIVYVGCDDPSDQHFDALQAMKQELSQMTNADGKPFNLVELPMAPTLLDEDGQRLPATYANFLITNKSILLPTYGHRQLDLLASQIIKIAFPDHEIKCIDCRALIRQHGSLHCVTMQLPSNIL